MISCMTLFTTHHYPYHYKYTTSKHVNKKLMRFWLSMKVFVIVMWTKSNQPYNNVSQYQITICDQKLMIFCHVNKVNQPYNNVSQYQITICEQKLMIFCYVNKDNQPYNNNYSHVNKDNQLYNSILLQKVKSPWKNITHH